MYMLRVKATEYAQKDLVSSCLYNIDIIIPTGACHVSLQKFMITLIKVTV